MIPFEHLGCTDEVRAAFEREREREQRRQRGGKTTDAGPATGDGAQRLVALTGASSAAGALVLGRVVSLDRGYPLVATEAGELRAELATTIKKSDDSIVAVGDWVALACPEAHEKAIIAAVLPRRVEIARVKRVGRERQIRRQVLAANVDTVFVCQSLTGEGVDWRLLVRQMAAVAGCGARPVFVFTKDDLVGQGEREATAATVAELAPEVEVVFLSSRLGEGVGRVRELAAPGTTSLLLGESGVGKSSLVNALVGSAVRDVGAVRASDDRGRHTTVARRMVEIPGGGLVIDAPGLRTLQIIDLEKSLRAAFPDICELALGCRFRDCGHGSEPGCAVRGEVAGKRLAAYRYLAAAPSR